MSERLLNAREIGDWLGLSTATVLDRYESGDLPGFTLYGRRGGPVRFRKSDIEAKLELWRNERGAGDTEYASRPRPGTAVRNNGISQ
jgi:predicted DNA-binding transcriptional regulator AlpA